MPALSTPTEERSHREQDFHRPAPASRAQLGQKLSQIDGKTSPKKAPPSTAKLAQKNQQIESPIRTEELANEGQDLHDKSLKQGGSVGQLTSVSCPLSLISYYQIYISDMKPRNEAQSQNNH
jgi:hypothetical protein